MNRRQFIAGGAALAAPAFAAKKKAAQPPNIVLIMADDLASWMLGCYGNQEIKTPNIDTLGRMGCRFVNSFVATPICSASRATILSGRLPRQHGIHDFLDDNPIENPPQGQRSAPASFERERLLSDILAGSGYNCGYVGKWHLGSDGKPGHSISWSYTMQGGSGPYQNPTMFLNGEAVKEQGYLAELMTKRACDFLDQQKTDKPFFLTVGYFNPHTPYEGHPQKYYDMYAGAKFNTVGWEPPAKNALREADYLKDIVGNIRGAAAATTALDDQIPVLLRRLQDRNFRDNTLVIFTSDNGYLLGRHGLWSKGHASNPINMYEEVIGVPMMWVWPGRIPAEAVLPEMISSYDLVPSVCAAAGLAAPSGLIGRNYAPLAMRQPLPKKEPWRNLVFGHFRNTEYARDTRFKLVLRDEGRSPGELYALYEDPGEKNNVYDEPGFVTVRDRMTRAIADWRQRTTAS